MRFDYWFLRDYKYYAARRLVDLCLIAVVLSLAFYFLDKDAMINFFNNRIKTEVSKLKISNKSYVHDSRTESTSEMVSSKVPKSCFFNDIRGCVCYDQHTIVIKDFPGDHARNLLWLNSFLVNHWCYMELRKLNSLYWFIRFYSRDKVIKRKYYRYVAKEK